MDILITGGSGFLGTVIISKFLKETDFNIVIYDLLEPEIKSKRLKFIKGDVLDSKKVDDACKNVDYIIHAVSLVPLANAGNLFFKVNVSGTEVLLQNALKNKIKKIIHISSSSIYGMQKKFPITEDSPIKPFEDYAKTKYQAEKICYKFRKKGLNIIIIRPRTIIGHGRLGIFQILFDWIENDNNVYVINGGKNKFQFISAEDLSDAILLSIKKNIKNEDFNVGSDKFLSMKEYLEKVINHAKSKSKIISLNKRTVIIILRLLELLRLSPLSKWHAYTYGENFYFDCTKIKNMLGWRPKHKDDETLIKTYDWYIEHKNEAFLKGKSIHKKAPNQKILRLLKSF